MYQFSPESLGQLATCHPDLQILFEGVIKYRDCKVTEGYRNKFDQEKAFAAGNTRLHWPNGKHNHLPSNAVDVYPYPVPSDKTERGRQEYYYFAGIVMGIADMLYTMGKMKHRIKWGGAWGGDLNKPGMLNDLVHYEIIL